MSEQLYVCENAKKCGNENECAFARQLPLEVHGCNGQESPWRDGCISGSKIVPVASQAAQSLYEALSTNSQPETERCTSDPDAAAAREYVKSATINNVEAGVYELDALLLRLADKVEGKS